MESEQGFEFSKWILGAAVILFAMAALFVAARTEETLTYYAALGFFALCVAVMFLGIKQIFDEKDHSGPH